MKQGISFFFLFFSCIVSLCAQSNGNSVSTSADVAGMAWDVAADSASSGGVVPGMGWNTTATTRIFVANGTVKPAVRRFTLQGFAVPNQFRGRCGIYLENKRKIIIKQ